MILSTSHADSDLQRAYDLHANCYIAKPVDLDEFLNVVRSIEQFWFNVVLAAVGLKAPLTGAVWCRMRVEWRCPSLHRKPTALRGGAEYRGSPARIRDPRHRQAGFERESVGPVSARHEGDCEEPRQASPLPNGGLDLRQVLAREFDLKVENVIAGMGRRGSCPTSSGRSFATRTRYLHTDAAFIGFQVLAKSRGVRYRTVPYKDWHYDLPALAREVNERTKIIYLANPNNPTGTIFTKHEFGRLLPARAGSRAHHSR